MRNAIASLFAGLTLATVASAQMPLPNFGNTYTSTQTRGFWFQAPVGFTITGLRVPNEALQAFQVVEVIDLGASPPPAFPGTVNGTQLFYSNNTAAGSTISCVIPVPPGSYIGILGACTATVGDTTSYNSYATPAGAFTSDILGNPVTITRFGTQSGIASNGGNQPCWQEAAGQLSRVEVFVAPSGGNYALAQTYGTGCTDRVSASFYETFPASTFDLANSNIMLMPTSDGYVAMPGAPGWWTPVGANLGLTDDSVSAALPLGFTLNYPGGSTTNVYASSNGFVWAQANTANGCCTGDPAQLVAGAARWSLLWNDLNPGVGGTVVFDTDPANGAAYITWSAVPEYANAANLNTFQIAFFSTGMIEYRWQSCTITGHQALVGWTPGATRNPGSIDLSTALPIITQPDLTALAHSSSARPVLGTTISLNTTNVPASAALGATLLGLAEINPGLDLTPLGMPGCFQYVGADATQIWFPAGGAGSLTWALPTSAAFAGVEVKTQSAALVPGINATGAITSNGLRLTLDLN